MRYPIRLAVSAALVSIWCVGGTRMAAIRQAASAPSDHLAPEMQRLAFMVGRFRESDITFSEARSTETVRSLTVEGSWMSGGRQARVVTYDAGQEVGTSIYYYDSNSHEYGEYDFSRAALPHESHGRFEGDRLIMTEVPTTRTAFGFTYSPAPAGGIRVDSVVPDGPMGRAGLRAGDDIVAIDGRSLAGVGVAESIDVMQQRRPAGTAVRFTVERGGARRDYTVKRSVVHSPPTRNIIAPKPNGGLTGTVEELQGGAWRKRSQFELNPTH